MGQTTRVTMLIEEEDYGVEAEENLLFGMCRDREDMADVEAYVRKLRAPRF